MIKSYEISLEQKVQFILKKRTKKKRIKKEKVKNLSQINRPKQRQKKFIRLSKNWKKTEKKTKKEKKKKKKK